MLALVPVRVADCRCPDNPHEGHHVLVSPTISLEGGIAAEKALREVALSFQSTSGGTKAEVAAREQAQAQALIYAWAPIFVRDGARDWDLCDDQGEPLPFDVEAILADYSLARLVAEKCNDLGYGSAVVAPFQQQPAKPSRNGRTRATTSQRPTPIHS